MTSDAGQAAEPTDRQASFPVATSRTGFRSGHVIEVRTDEVEMPDGSHASRDVVVHPGAVGIIALDADRRVLLLRQYRHPVGRLLWEPPAGLLDEPGEDPLDAAKRELFEEAHQQAQRWDVLVDAFTSPGMTDEAVRIYLAREVREAEAPRFQGEHEEVDMPVVWVPLETALTAVLDGRLHNPLAVMGVLAAAHAARHDFAGLRAATADWPEMSTFTGSGSRHVAS
jgi:ADP-ribose pyrophosphatase